LTFKLQINDFFLNGVLKLVNIVENFIYNKID